MATPTMSLASTPTAPAARPRIRAFGNIPADRASGCGDIAQKRKASLKSPDRAAKIGDAKRGRPISEEARAAIARAKKGQKHSAQTRRKMGEAQRRRVRPPRGGSFEPEVTALLGTTPDREVAERTGLTEAAVVSRRRVLKIAAFVKRAPQGKQPRGTPERDSLLGTRRTTRSEERRVG